MENEAETLASTKKIYREKAVWAGAFLGGPLVAGYFIAENFKTFEQSNKAKKTWIYTIIATIIIFGIIFSIPDNVKFPNQLIPLIYTGIAYYLMQHYQSENIQSHIASGGQYYGWGRIIVIGLIGLVTVLILVFGVLYLNELRANAAMTSKLYGTLKHEIGFDKSNISEIEIDKIANGLINSNFFDEDSQKYVFASKVGNNYELSIACNHSIIDNQEAIIWFTQLRKDMQTLYPNNGIVINLIVDNLDNVVKRLE